MPGTLSPLYRRWTAHAFPALERRIDILFCQESRWPGTVCFDNVDWPFCNIGGTHDVDGKGQALHVRGEPVEEDLDGLVVPVVGASCGVVAEVLDGDLAPEARLKLPEVHEVDDAGDAVLVALVGLWLVLRLGLELGLQGPELGLRASCASKTVRTRSQHWRDRLRTMVLLASWPWGISAPAAE